MRAAPREHLDRTTRALCGSERTRKDTTGQHFVLRVLQTLRSTVKHVFLNL